MSVKRTCLHANESYYDRERKGYFLAQVTEDEPGYIQTFGLWNSSELAKAIATTINEGRGLSEDDVLDIVASSMRAGPVLR